MNLDASFINDLMSKYESKENGPRFWTEEGNGVKLALESVSELLRQRYEIVSPVNIGGTAVVVKVTDKNLGVPRALKLPRPLAGREILLKRIMDSEIARLVECSHPNIVSIYDKGEINLNGVTWPFYIMEFLDGAVDGQEWLERSKPCVQAIIRFLQQVVEGLVFLHRRNTIHGDVKLENVLVMPDGHVKLSDLGSARLLEGDPDGQTVLTFTRPFAHPLLRGLLSDTSGTDPNRVQASIKRSQLSKVFDLYALGKNLIRLLAYYDPVERELLPQYERRYLELMAYRMLDGRIANIKNGLIPPENVFQEIRYASADEVCLDLKKLTGEYNLCHVVSELDHHFPRSIQSSQPHGAALTDRVANILASPYFRRLGGISQLGLIVQIYPTATHSRLEHVLGCYSNVARYIDALWQDAINPFFRQVFTEHDINVALVGALCHDIGQYPMAHDMEEADNDLFSHRAIGSHILTSMSDADSKALRELLRTEWGVTPEDVVELLSTKPTDLSQPIKRRFLHSLIDGPLDADKLDYLIRDSLNLNVPYGKGIDVERLLKCLTVVFKQQGDRTFVTMGIHEKGKIPAEAVAFARYAMFGAVYWHHTSRSAKAMLHRALWEAIPKWDRRSKEYRDFKEAFFAEVGGQGRLIHRSATQGNLFVDQTTRKLIAETPQLAVSDYNMLCWLYEKTTADGKRLIEMLCRRDLFKRLLVVSHRRNSALWELLARMKHNASSEDMIEFQKTFQDAIIRSIDAVEDEKRVSTVMQKTFTDAIVGRNAQGEILFLVDIPGDRPGTTTGLYFLPEHRTQGPLTATTENREMEDSVVWNSLSTQFVASVGKIRVFCAPDIAETCTVCLRREDIEGVLEGAARQALQETHAP